MLGTSIPVLIIIMIRILLIIRQVHCTCPQAILLAMIPCEKQLTGFYEYGAPLGSLPELHLKSTIK